MRTSIAFIFVLLCVLQTANCQDLIEQFQRCIHKLRCLQEDQKCFKRCCFRICEEGDEECVQKCVKQALAGEPVYDHAEETAGKPVSGKPKKPVSGLAEETVDDEQGTYFQDAGGSFQITHQLGEDGEEEMVSEEEETAAAGGKQLSVCLFLIFAYVLMF